MILRGVPAGAATPRADWNQTDPSMADFIKGKEQVEAAIAANAAQIARLPKLTLAIGDTVPEAGPVLWFNTAPGGAAATAKMLALDGDEGGYDVRAVVGDETYGVQNATVNQGAAAGSYDFTVL